MTNNKNKKNGNFKIGHAAIKYKVNNKGFTETVSLMH